MTAFVTYDTATGALLQVSICPDSVFPLLPDEEAGRARTEIPDYPPDTMGFLLGNFVDAGTVTTKTAITPTISATSFAADGTTTCDISGLPDPCSVTITGVLSAGPADVTGGSISLTSDVPGDLTIAVSAGVAFLPCSLVIHAV